MKTLGIGMVGARWGGARIQHANYQNLPPGLVEIRGVCTRSRESAESFARDKGVAFATNDFVALLARENIDVIDVCTPPASRHEIPIGAIADALHFAIGDSRCATRWARAAQELRIRVEAESSACEDAWFGIGQGLVSKFRPDPVMTPLSQEAPEARLHTQARIPPLPIAAISRTSPGLSVSGTRLSQTLLLFSDITATAFCRAGSPMPPICLLCPIKTRAALGHAGILPGGDWIR